MDIKKWLKKLETNPRNNKNNKNNKNNINLLIVILIGVLFLIAGSFFKDANVVSKDKENKNNQQQKEENKETAAKDYEEEIQNKLKNTLEKMEGVGRVEVMISFESGEEKVPAVNINNATNKTVEKDTEGGTRNTTQENEGSSVVITNNGDKTEPLIVKEFKPKITGICIVAEGAEENITKLRISKAVVDLFTIPENKVNVYPMKR